MKTIVQASLFLVFGFLSACTPPIAECGADGGVCDLATCTPGQSVVGASEPPGANCTYGGVKYVSESGINYVCTGAIGPTGITGAAGAQGSAGPSGPGVVSEDEPVGTNCVFGGIKYTSPSGVNFLCAGGPGATGASGAAGSNGATGAQGMSGSIGATGATGAAGTAGTTGAAGAAGAAGQSVVASSEGAGANCATGGSKYVSASGTAYVCNGAAGPAGAVGAVGPIGLTGAVGPIGLTGATGDIGATGATGGNLEFGFFFALMPGDNSATVAAGSAVSFSQNGAASGIVRASATQFTLPAIGIYEISWQVSVDEPGQLVLGLDTGAGSMEQAFSVVGRAAGNSLLVNHVLLTTTVINSILTVRNPAGNPSALTITPIAGGTSSVSATLLIKRIR